MEESLSPDARYAWITTASTLGIFLERVQGKLEASAVGVSVAYLGS